MKYLLALALFAVSVVLGHHDHGGFGHDGPRGGPHGPPGGPWGPDRHHGPQFIDFRCINSSVNSTTDTTINSNDTIKFFFALETTRVARNATQAEYVTALTQTVAALNPDSKTNLDNAVTSYIACVFNRRNGGSSASTTTQATTVTTTAST